MFTCNSWIKSELQKIFELETQSKRVFHDQGSAEGYNPDSRSLPQIMVNRNKVLQHEFAQEPWEQSTPATTPCPPVTVVNIGLSTRVCNSCHPGHTNHLGHSVSQITHYSPYHPKDPSTADSYKWAPNCLNAAQISHLPEWKTNQWSHISWLSSFLYTNGK